MKQVGSVSDLKKIKSKYLRSLSENEDNGTIEIKIGMSTCGIASGAGEIMRVFREECEFQAIDVIVKKTGCLGYCYAEPMVEIKLPGARPKVYGYVDKKRAKEIIEKYIIRGEAVDGEIEISYQSVND